MKLRELLRKANLTADSEVSDTEISDIVTDSRKADYGSMFVCISGALTDGHDYPPSPFDGSCGCSCTK